MKCQRLHLQRRNDHSLPRSLLLVCMHFNFEYDEGFGEADVKFAVQCGREQCVYMCVSQRCCCCSSSITRDVSKQSLTGAVWRHRLPFALVSDAQNPQSLVHDGSVQSKDLDQRGHDLQRLPLNAFHGSAKGSREAFGFVLFCFLGFLLLLSPLQLTCNALDLMADIQIALQVMIAFHVENKIRNRICIPQHHTSQSQKTVSQLVSQLLSQFLSSLRLQQL